MKTDLVSRAGFLAAVLLLAAPGVHADAREKVDVVVVTTGDRLTGEITSLAYGRLTLETDYMGTVQIEWPDVVRVESPQQFLLEDTDGNMLYGRIARDAQPGHLAIAGADNVTRRVGMLKVARISPSEAKLIDRVRGSLSLGFDYAKSSNIKTLSGNFNMNYRGRETVWNFGVDLNSTRDPVQGTIDRHAIEYGHRFLRPGGRFWAGVSSVERNEETGIEARLLIGGGYGSYFLQTSSNEVAALVGLAASREWATGQLDYQDSLEVMIGADWRVFDFATPKTNLTAKGVLFPSLTESDRYRTQSSLSLRREIVSDFYLDLSLFHTYDTDPPDVEAENTDYGFITSLGYSF
jgi:putative salt-induced outer membrane protein YdiY